MKKKIININIISIFCPKYYLYNITELAQVNFSSYNILKIQKNKERQRLFSLRSIDGTKVGYTCRENMMEYGTSV